MELNNQYKKQLRGDFFQILNSGFGINRSEIKSATPEQIKSSLVQLYEQQKNFNLDQREQFKTWFLEIFADVRKLIHKPPTTIQEMNLLPPITFKEFLMQKDTYQAPVSGNKDEQVDTTMKNLLATTDVAPGEGSASRTIRSAGSVQ